MPRVTLRDALREAAAGLLPAGWLYLPAASPLSLDTSCILIPHCETGGMNPQGVPLAAVAQGYPVEGLDSDSISEIVVGARQLANPPSEELLLEAFVYYLRFDAFLPYVGAPDPPPREEIQLAIDREFYASLGGERPSVPCRAPNCQRGAVDLSVLCRVHHFEMIRKKRCPFTD